jgi:hypothetical protein
MVCPERILAMKPGFALPIVGSAVSSAAGLSASCRGLEDLGYDTLWAGDRLVTPVAVHSTYRRDQLVDEHGERRLAGVGPGG